MTYEFKHYERRDGRIMGELENGEGVVTIHDEDWKEVDEDNLKGNWEEVTSKIITEVLNSPSQGATNGLSVEKERAVDILSESDIIRAEYKNERRLQANLLIDYLIFEDVFAHSGDQVIILEEFSLRSGIENKLNYAAFLSNLKDKTKNTIKTAQKEAEKVADLIAVGEPPDADEATTEELLEDLKRITEDKVEPRGWDEYGDPIPPKGVDDDDSIEYQDLIGRLRSKEAVNIGRGENPEKAKQKLNKKVNQLEVLLGEFEEGEYLVRQSAITNIASVNEVMNSVKKAQEAAPDIFNGNPVGEEDTEEVAETVLGLADEYDVDVTDDTEPVEEEDTPIDISSEETDEAVSDNTASANDDVLFGDEAQNG